MIDKYGTGKEELIKDEMQPVLEDVKKDAKLLDWYIIYSRRKNRSCYSF